MIILELWYCGELAVVFLVPGLPCLNLTLFAAIPLGPALGTLLVSLVGLCFLRAVGAELLPGNFPLLHLVHRLDAAFST